MQALQLTSYGRPATVSEVEDPVPGPGEVRVAVRAAGLNPLDAKLAQGWMAEAMPLPLPCVLGFDFAGVVEAVGDGVSRFAVGDEVVGMGGPPRGVFAELVVVAADGPTIERKPAGLTMSEAAALPMVGFTAKSILRALTVRGNILVIGATGGIGMVLVPLLAADPASEVLVTAAGEEAEALRAAGATHAFGHRDADLATEVLERFPDGVDVVVDLVHQLDALAPTTALLRPGGQLVSTLFGPDLADLPRQDIELTYIRNQPADGDLAELAEAAGAHRIQIDVTRTYALAEGPDALEALLTDHVVGKRVITVP